MSCWNYLAMIILRSECDRFATIQAAAQVRSPPPSPNQSWMRSPSETLQSAIA
ncbi:hypothetical protein QUA56_26090 [Microcoleus sp. N3A4]|uniref:hypothetical protein n=1 Tax=Microcoleus sp. N3A4 TaxID=3055379 RepID=UPI002FCEFDD7